MKNFDDYYRLNEDKPEHYNIDIILDKLKDIEKLCIKMNNRLYTLENKAKGIVNFGDDGDFEEG